MASPGHCGAYVSVNCGGLGRQGKEVLTVYKHDSSSNYIRLSLRNSSTCVKDMSKFRASITFVHLWDMSESIWKHHSRTLKESPTYDPTWRLVGLSPFPNFSVHLTDTAQSHTRRS
ncbi:hypothetical protein RRG08_013309 [Elysia crispata]|uniref:Uncharacterized protein n=1 Tax=Elysia crispata TaxID=231223 RepID=A0AAE1E5Y1_9GAST|nr:hypothetical protein RRG08_013309 [Elysia crispata]